MARPSSPFIPPTDGERWQLLNLYVDGVATADERQACEALLDQDPAWRQQLQQLRRLRSALQSLPGEPSARNARELADGVFVAQARQGRSRRLWLAAGVALAAILGGGSWLVGDRSLQVAQQPEQNAWMTAAQPHNEPLYLALDEPVISVPGSVQEVVYESSR